MHGNLKKKRNNCIGVYACHLWETRLKFCSNQIETLGSKGGHPGLHKMKTGMKEGSLIEAGSLHLQLGFASTP